jgi:adenylate kinase
MVIHLDVPGEALITRLAARRQCPACSRIYNLLSQPPRRPGICDADGATLICREDDQEEVIRRRLQAYEELTGPVLKYYANAACSRLDGTRAPAEVSREIEILLDQAVPVSV